MKNPWVEVDPNTSFVLESDRKYVDAFNQLIDDGAESALGRVKARPPVEPKLNPRSLRTDLPPIPFIGRYQAPVVLLAANPSHDEKSSFEDLSLHGLELILGSIQTPGGTPFWPLLECESGTSAAHWWGARTDALLHAVGDRTLLTNGLLVVDFHGYRSKTWTPPFVSFPSQAFGFQLVREALARKAIIVIVKCLKHWLGSVPELLNYPYLVPGLSSTQNSFLTPKNMRSDNFDLVVRQLRHENPWQSSKLLS